MKRKVIAVALSLALLTGLFVFAVPVTAVGESDNANSFTIWFDNTSSPVPQPSTNEWFGKPVEVTLPDGRNGPLLTLIVPGQFSILNHPWPFEGVGDFGPEIGYLSDADWEIDITAHINYNVPHVLGHWDWTITTDVGDLVISCETKRSTGW